MISVICPGLVSDGGMGRRQLDPAQSLAWQSPPPPAWLFLPAGIFRRTLAPSQSHHFLSQSRFSIPAGPAPPRGPPCTVFVPALSRGTVCRPLGLGPPSFQGLRSPVAEKSQFWLHVASVTFPFASGCFCSLKGYSPYRMACLGDLWPSAWMLIQSVFFQDPVYLWVAMGRKKLTCPLPEPGHSRWYLQDEWLLLYFLTSFPHLCSLKEPGIQTP